jgi:hypothetical protein
MKTPYVVFTIRKYPGENTETIFYIKKIKSGKPMFTSHKNEAMRTELLKAFLLSIRYRVKSIPVKFV